MLHIHTGQCGLCVHFGEEHPDDQKLIQIRRSMEAAEDFIDECRHPMHEKLHLKVTAVSACDGFEPATVH
ncbi:MAG: hypothetical protein JOY54_15385 [Acidobacteriaceae bacterium]|nr:hypothetical protein [Acidobacteriaceae bacterium]